VGERRAPRFIERSSRRRPGRNCPGRAAGNRHAPLPVGRQSPARAPSVAPTPQMCSSIGRSARRPTHKRAQGLARS